LVSGKKYGTGEARETAVGALFLAEEDRFPRGSRATTDPTSREMRDLSGFYTFILVRAP
jgi:hypothetical protein